MKKHTNLKNLKGLFSLIVTGLVLSIGFQGCVPLDENPGEVQLAPGAYTDISELSLGVTGIYASLRNASQWSTFYVNGWSGDDITTHKASNKADFREHDQRAITNENNRTVSNWRNIYGMIFNANTVLKNIGETVFVGQEDEQNALLGETYFLRGAMFFHLYRVHGRIALLTTPDIDFEITLSSELEVLQQIEADFLKAAELLPDLYPGVQDGAPRPNSGSAKAMLARLYMDWAGFPVKDNSKYALAASTAKEVIDNAAAHGFELEEDPGKIWSLAGRFTKESVWTIPYCVSCGTRNGKFARLGWPSDNRGWGETFAEIRYFEDFPEGARKNATYRMDADWVNFSDQVTPVFRKIVGPANEDNVAVGFHFTDRSDYYMRYPEVLLIYAEASARSGSSSADAWEALNMVRRRAAGLDYMTAYGSAVSQRVRNADESAWEDHPSLMYQDVSSGDLADLAVQERKWELAGEWIRWNDLVRLELVADAFANRDPQVTPDVVNGGIIAVQNDVIGSTGTDNYFAPIPIAEIDLLPGLGN
ncbi:RagB/SusD family nutrient uptake outer membrane protein [Seonamhaeicola marinus]|uniref:RagB/SusD family nutrient uptake outer membrane protein n=1 Tax=Seonamhaeicola marinus TaxID=1912246 RepID=A0A5D0HRX6_9FLAO|nr:RagB/SusD family nutrient uptake outer membrane protein [Seonamhaeicola marinus]TYA74113.1 RagB/SusD family nutrient uptake outer membrane protein [Seonamhaeicola marinus]